MLGLCWDQIGAIGGPSRPKWEHLGAILDHFGSPRRCFGDAFSRSGFRCVFCSLFHGFCLHFRSAPDALVFTGKHEEAFSHFLRFH